MTWRRWRPGSGRCCAPPASRWGHSGAPGSPRRWRWPAPAPPASCAGAPGRRWPATPAEIRTLDRVFDAVFAGLTDPADHRGDAPDRAAPPTRPPRRRPDPPAPAPADPSILQLGTRTSPENPFMFTDPSARSTGQGEDEGGREVEYPWAASAQERLADRDFADLSPDELALLRDAMSRVELATPPRRSRRTRRVPHAGRVDLRVALAPRWPHRRRPAAARAPPPPGRAAPAGRAVRHLRLDGAVRPRPAATALLRRRGAGRGLHLRHPAHPADQRAGRSVTRRRAGSGRSGRSGLVRRHPDRRRPEGVHRRPRPARDGPRRGAADHLRRLGDRRPGAARAPDGPTVAAGVPRSCGSTRGPAARATGRWPAAWPRPGRTATRWSAGTGWPPWRIWRVRSPTLYGGGG